MVRAGAISAPSYFAKGLNITLSLTPSFEHTLFMDHTLIDDSRRTSSGERQAVRLIRRPPQGASDVRTGQSTDGPRQSLYSLHSRSLPSGKSRGSPFLIQFKTVFPAEVQERWEFLLSKHSKLLVASETQIKEMGENPAARSL